VRPTLAALVAGFALALTPAAAAACPRTSIADVEDEVMCPVCGTPLSLATEAPQAQRERELIRRLVDDCRSKDEVKTALAAEFGDDVLAVPEDEGFDLAAYLVPALAILLASGGVALAAAQWRRSHAREQAERPARGAAVPDRRESSRLESDLERYDL
jgi:cytochrome c-type biogenesis protein CcmH